jgi:heme exporter protein D
MSHWQSWSDFVAMGGYGLYVWGSYAVTVACVIVELYALAGRRRRVREALKSLSLRTK